MQKTVLIKEELVESTGHFAQAVLLNQFFYWAERKEFEEWINEEIKNYFHETEETMNSSNKNHGWIYKSAREINEETMMGMSEETIRKHLNDLVKSGYLDVRNNPVYRWDRTKQYRVNLVKTFQSIRKAGFQLRDFEEFKKAVESIPIFRGSISSKSGIQTLKQANGNRSSVGAISETTSENDEMKIIHRFEEFQRKKIRQSDVKYIEQLLELNLKIEEKLWLIEKCFSDFQTKKKGDKINSFKYVLNYVKYHLENKEGNEESTNASSTENDRSNAQAATEKMSVDKSASTAYEWHGSVDVDF